MKNTEETTTYNKGEKECGLYRSYWGISPRDFDAMLTALKDVLPDNLYLIVKRIINRYASPYLPHI